jgi:TonB family protein
LINNQTKEARMSLIRLYSKDPDDLESVDTRCAPDPELTARINSHSDIFICDRQYQTYGLQAICNTAAIILGLWLSSRQVMPHLINDSEFDYDKTTDKQIEVTLIQKPLNEHLASILRPEKYHTDNISSVKAAVSIKIRGGGSPIERATASGILGILSGKITGKTAAIADAVFSGTIANAIDMALVGVKRLSTNGKTGSERKGVPGIGFAPGISGTSGGGGGTGDALEGLFCADPASGLTGRKGNIGALRIIIPPECSYLSGGRNRTEIMRVVMQNLGGLRHAYNKRLFEKPALRGKVTVKFAIDEFGNVIFCEAVESSMGDPEFDKLITDKIRRWAFGPVDKPGDVTEIVYPFVFSM